VSHCAREVHATVPPERADRERRPAAGALKAGAVPFAVEPLDETERRTRIERLKELLGERVVLLDGAMGTMIQQHRLDERGFRGERFTQHGRDLRGNNDILTLTRPDIVSGIHRAYLAAGADIIETNTFNSNSISQGDYGTEALTAELNYRAARLARAAADEYAAHSRTPRFVAGALGPTTRMASLSPDDLARAINDLTVKLDGVAPIARAISTAGGISFDEVDADFMMRRLPGIFAAGEMLDWEAPTGGYLLQACFATGAAAGRGAAGWANGG